MSNITFICCSSASAAQAVVEDVESGELWGVSMGTTSKSAAYSNYVLVDATEKRTLSLLESVPDDEKYEIQSSLIDADSFTEADLVWKVWFLRGRL
tara:strand:+ start:216 stop:503 length:288 start_codon:yes stop_codon:yes gene_type:complete